MTFVVVMDGRNTIYYNGHNEIEVINLKDLQERMCPICGAHVSFTEELVSYEFSPKVDYKKITVDGVDYVSVAPVGTGETAKEPIYKLHQICKTCGIDWEHFEFKEISQKVNEKNEAHRTD
jgi:hypothetical protein